MDQSSTVDRPQPLLEPSVPNVSVPGQSVHSQSAHPPAAHDANVDDIRERCDSQARRLELLHDISRRLTSILERPRLLEKVAEDVKQLIDYELFGVLLWNANSQSLEHAISIRSNGCLSTRKTLELDQGLCGAAARERRPIRVDDVTTDPRYVGCDARVRSELAVPLLFEDRLIGVLDLESFTPGFFTAEDEVLLSTLAANLAVALENSRLYERVKADEQRMARELSAARETQRVLLPRSTPWLPGLRTAVAYCPARHLGGDLYDFLSYGEGQTAIALGDVAGKGTGSALYASLAVGLLRGFVSESRCDPSCVLSYLNDELVQLQADKRFLALAFAVFDRSTHGLTLANSGVPFPYLIRRGPGDAHTVESLPIGGLPLGKLSDITYQGLEVTLEPGDTVVFTSDGIEECLGPHDEPFGEGRLEATLGRLAGHSAEAIADGLLAATDTFLDGREPSDDRTIVVLQVAP